MPKPYSKEYLDMVHRYVELCGDIVNSTESQCPFRSIWQAYKGKLGDKELPVKIKVYEDAPCAETHMKLSNGDLVTAVSDEHKDDEHPEWKVRASYLKKVLDNPDYYKQNPAQLDWSWLSDIRA